MGWVWHRSLAARLILFLSVALIPVGLLAVMQTGNLVRQADERANAALVGLTRDAALAEREVIQRAFGMAVGLAPLAVESWDDRSRCENSLASFVANQHTAITVGVIRPDGEMWCASNGMRYDFSEFPGWGEIATEPRPTVEVNTNAPISGRPVVVITQPFERDGRFAGFVFVSVPHERLELQDAELSDENLTVITFTASGEFLTATGRDAEDPQAVLPQTRPLETLVGVGTRAFRDRTASGEDRHFAVSPIFADTVYALGTWQPMSVAANAPFAIPPQLFPVIMWLTSLGGAIAAIHRLVIRHIRRLRRQMLDFAAHRTLPPADNTGEVSAEIADIQMSFADMAETVIRDEAELEQLVSTNDVTQFGWQALRVKSRVCFNCVHSSVNDQGMQLEQHHQVLLNIISHSRVLCW